MANFQRYAIPLSVWYCPTRRNVLTYPWDAAMWLHGVINCSPYMPVAVGRSDYAINGGDHYTTSGIVGSTWLVAKWAGDYLYGGPASLADGGVPPCSPQQLVLARETFSQVAQSATGVSYCGSLIKLSEHQRRDQPNVPARREVALS